MSGPWEDYASDGPWNDYAAKPQPAPPAENRNARALKLGTRDVVQGVLNLPAMIVDGAAALASVMPPPFGPGRSPFDPAPVDTKSAIPELLDRFGLPRAQNDKERMVSVINQGGAGAISSAGMGSLASGMPGITGEVAKTFAAQPVMQFISGQTGGASAEYARQKGAGPFGQFVAGVVGGSVPAVVSAVAPGAVRYGFRGGEQGRQRVQDNIDTFASAGTTPTVGQATESRTMRAAESMLTRLPGSAGVMADKASSQADEIGGQIDEMAGRLAPKASGEQAGLQIERGIKGDAVSGDPGFLGYFRTTAKRLYDKLDDYIKPNAEVKVTNTRAALDRLNQEIENAPELSKQFQNSRLLAIQDALDADTALPPRREVVIGAGGTSQVVDVPQGPREWMPYEAIKKLRTLVDDQIADSGLMSDVPRSKWMALRSALTDDLEAAAKAAGPKAEQAFSRANTFYRAGARRIEVISKVLDANGGPEKVFQAATAGTKEGASTLRAVMQSLPDDAQKTVAATILRRLGRAKAGVQNDAGDMFSTETFLTNWAGLSAEAKRVIADRFGPQFRADMDQIAKVASNLRAGSQVFRNPSGTAQATAQVAGVTSILTALLTGQVQAAVGIGSGMIAANRIAQKLMVNPRFVRWLASTTKMPTAQIPAAINQLSLMANKTNDRDMLVLSEMLRQQTQQPPQGERKQQKRQQ